MKHVLPLVVLVAFLIACPLVAQGDADDLDAKLKEIDAKLEELTKLKSDLEKMRDDMTGAPADEKAGWEDKVKINGYFHQRYLYRDWGKDEFILRRMYINLIVTPNDRTQAVVTWARIGPDPMGLTNADWANVFVDYKLNDALTARVGQGPDWFGLETGQGSSARLALERAAVLEGGQGKPLGLYFAGPWDRGVWLVRKPTSGNPWDPKVILGAINGQFRNVDRDNNKTITVDLKWPQKWGEFGASWFDGTWGNDLGIPGVAPITDREAILGYVRYDPDWCDFAVQGEYVDGELMGNDIEGWYAQLEYDPAPKGTAYVKYQKYDPAVGVGGNDYDAFHVGYAHQLDKNNELTVEWTNGKWRGATHPSRDELSAQWQLGF